MNTAHSTFSECTHAILCGDADRLRALLAHATSVPNSDRLLLSAVLQGRPDMVETLLPHSDPKARDSYALSMAAQYGHIECVRLLLPISNPKAANSRALCYAAQKNDIQCVMLLLPHSNAQANHSIALQWACTNENETLIGLLYPLSQPKQAWKKLQQRVTELNVIHENAQSLHTQKIADSLARRIQSYEQQAKLHKAVHNNKNATEQRNPQRKI